MMTIGPTRRSFLQRLVAAGSVAVAAPALVLEELREREHAKAVWEAIYRHHELAVESLRQSIEDWFINGTSMDLYEDENPVMVIGEPLRPSLMESIAARANRA